MSRGVGCFAILVLAFVSMAAFAQSQTQTDYLFSLQGGYQHFEGQNKFIGRAEGAFAFKTDNGLFFQGSLMAEGNNVLSQYGESVGMGYEPKKFGFFLFADALQYKLGDFGQTNHYQIRPAMRYHTDKIAFEMYYAHKIGSDQFLGTMTSVTTSGTSQITTQDQIWNEALDHGGFYLRGILNNRFSLHVQGDIAEKSVYRLQAGAEVAIGKGWSATLDFRTQHYGDYALWTTPLPTNNTWEAFIGFSYRFGGEKIAHEALAYRLLMATDYPIVVQRHAVSSTTKVTNANHNPTITGLTATPNPVSNFNVSTIAFTLNDTDPGDTISWTATLTENPPSGGSLDTTSGGPVASGTGVTIHYNTGEPCNATITITATDSHGGTSQASIGIGVQ
jgi:hypothetical protein